MDPAVSKILHDAFRRAMDDPAVGKALERQGMEKYYMSGAEYTKWVQRVAEEERRAVDRLGLKK